MTKLMACIIDIDDGTLHTFIYSMYNIFQLLIFLVFIAHQFFKSNGMSHYYMGLDNEKQIESHIIN
jgi:hypothetical protein